MASMLSMVASSTGVDGLGEGFGFNGGDAAETPFAGSDFSRGGEIARGFGLGFLGERVEEGLEIGRVFRPGSAPARRAVVLDRRPSPWTSVYR
jgi:hypothetical protein